MLHRRLRLPWRTAAGNPTARHWIAPPTRESLPVPSGVAGPHEAPVLRLQHLVHGGRGRLLGCILRMVCSNSKLLVRISDEEMEKNTTRLLKVARLSFPIGIVATTVGCIHELWKQKIKLSGSSAAAVFNSEDRYAQGVLISGLACILELLAGPLYILSQNLFLIKLRLIGEVAATLMRCMTAYILIKSLNMIAGLDGL